jgi:hypothetical protein
MGDAPSSALPTKPLHQSPSIRRTGAHGGVRPVFAWDSKIACPETSEVQTMSLWVARIRDCVDSRLQNVLAVEVKVRGLLGSERADIHRHIDAESCKYLLVA